MKCAIPFVKGGSFMQTERGLCNQNKGPPTTKERSCARSGLTNTGMTSYAVTNKDVSFASEEWIFPSVEQEQSKLAVEFVIWRKKCHFKGSNFLNVKPS
ncbi:hypothetical protein HNY73_013691 [Argiope bruennichi]|uniref:Uncharacterized protein n=1 Tax=Argiope bruennichi TaxID=94029 RepID=A0A8T0F4U5_ARGBR|nr:hypothetical protein HNY73_013691 [Argiope bruennichi]